MAAGAAGPWAPSPATRAVAGAAVIPQEPVRGGHSGLAPLPCRWCTRSPATGPTPSGSTPCWTPRKCRAAGAKPTPKTKSSELGRRGGGRGRLAWDAAPGGGRVTGLSHSPPHRVPCGPPSPIKSEFIRAKYQMLAFVHKLPCRDDDGVTAKDLSKVGGAPAGDGWASCLVTRHTPRAFSSVTTEP